VRRGLVETIQDEFPNVQVGQAGDSQSCHGIGLAGKLGTWCCSTSRMPGRSGLDILKEIKQERPKLPVRS